MLGHKKKLLVAVLCATERDGWICPDLMLDLLRMQRDSRWSVEVQPVRDISQHDTARNTAVVMARKARVDYLWMLDNDNSFGPRADPMGILTDAERRNLDVFALPYMRFEGNKGIQPTMRGDVYGATEDRAWADIEALSTGTMAIARRVWETIPGPWFKFEHDDTELHAITMPESFNFCQVARSHGFKVWVSKQGARHWRTGELSEMQMRWQKV